MSIARTLPTYASVEMIVVSCQHLHDARISAQPGLWPDEHANRASANKPIDKVLSQSAVDLIRVVRWALTPIATREEEVDVQPVLVRDVSRAEPAAARAGQVADSKPWRAWMRARIRTDDAQDEPDESCVAPPPRRPVGLGAENRIPGEEVQAVLRQLHAAQEPPPVRQPHRARVAPDDTHARRPRPDAVDDRHRLAAPAPEGDRDLEIPASTRDTERHRAQAH
jgi:hypothetical protein